MIKMEEIKGIIVNTAKAYKFTGVTDKFCEMLLTSINTREVLFVIDDTRGNSNCTTSGDYCYFENYKCTNDVTMNSMFSVEFSTSANFDYCPYCGQFISGNYDVCSECQDEVQYFTVSDIIKRAISIAQEEVE